jgi:hypothetical protein
MKSASISASRRRGDARRVTSASVLLGLAMLGSLWLGLL